MKQKTDENGWREKLLLNRTEAADYIGVHRHTLRRWEEQEVGPQPQKIGGHGRAFYARQALDQFVASFPGAA